MRVWGMSKRFQTNCYHVEWRHHEIETNILQWDILFGGNAIFFRQEQWWDITLERKFCQTQNCNLSQTGRNG